MPLFLVASCFRSVSHLSSFLARFLSPLRLVTGSDGLQRLCFGSTDVREGPLQENMKDNSHRDLSLPIANNSFHS